MNETIRVTYEELDDPKVDQTLKAVKASKELSQKIAAMEKPRPVSFLVRHWLHLIAAIIVLTLIVWGIILLINPDVPLSTPPLKEEDKELVVDAHIDAAPGHRFLISTTIQSTYSPHPPVTGFANSGTRSGSSRSSNG